MIVCRICALDIEELRDGLWSCPLHEDLDEADQFELDNCLESRLCTCRKPISFHHADGRVTCVRCRGTVEEEVGEG